MSTSTGPDKRGKKKRRKSYRSKRYIYTVGDEYPGIVAGHKECVGTRVGFNGVPPTMGWLWNLAEPRKGWRPGALGKSVLKLMKLKLAPASQAGASASRGKKKRIVENKQDVDQGEYPSDFEDDVIEPKAALQVSRQGDIITVTVHPLRDVSEIEDGEDPFMSCDPIIFKIVQQPTPERAAKRIAKERKRYEEDIKKSLESALEEICQCAYEDVYCTDLSAIDAVIGKAPAFVEGPKCNCNEDSEEDSGSDWDIEYTPPFAMTGLKPRRPTVCHQETQYSEADFARKVKMSAKQLAAEASSLKVAKSGSNNSQTKTLK